MGVVDNGNQIISYSYTQEVIASSMNRMSYGLLPPGIYSGGTLLRTSDTSIEILPFALYYKDTVNNLGVRIETTQSALVTVNNTKPFIVGRFEWIDSIDNYMDFVAISNAEITATDIIFGRLIFNGTVLTTEYDYSRKMWASPYYTGYNDPTPPFKVVANEPYDNKVTVRPGSMFINGQTATISTDTQSPAFTLPAPVGGKVDVVVIDKDANISVLTSGSMSPSLISNLYYPIAYVTFPASATEIRGSYINYIHPSIVKSPAFSTYGGTTVGNLNGNVPINNGALNTNLNAQYLNGVQAASANTASTIVLRDTNGNANFTTIGVSKPSWKLISQDDAGTQISCTNPRIVALVTSGTVRAMALLDNNTGNLSYYSYANSIFTSVGTPLNIGADANSAITAFSATEVVAYTGGQIRSYSWNGAAWSSSSTVLSVAFTNPTITALSNQRIAITNTHGSGATLSVYQRPASTWTLLGSALDIGARTIPSIVNLGSNYIAYLSNDKYLRGYYFDGSTWAESGTPLSIMLTTPTALAITALNSTDIVVIDDSINVFRIYRYTPAVGFELVYSSATYQKSSVYALTSLSGTEFISYSPTYNLFNKYLASASAELPTRPSS
jgi:hypothetical protein